MTLTLCEDNLQPSDCGHIRPRVGVRAVLKHNDGYILIYHQHWNLYTLPGGGVEHGETLEEALQRELLEETGYRVRILGKTLELSEYFYDSVWHHHYYLCETVGEPIPLRLTDLEIEAGHQVISKVLHDVLTLFNNHESTHRHAENICQREFLGFIHSLETPE